MRIIVITILALVLFRAIRFFFRMIDGDQKNKNNLNGGGLSGTMRGITDNP